MFELYIISSYFTYKYFYCTNKLIDYAWIILEYMRIGFHMHALFFNKCEITGEEAN